MISSSRLTLVDQGCQIQSQDSEIQ